LNLNADWRLSQSERHLTNNVIVSVPTQSQQAILF
jgi:hypothetical protein